MKKFFGMVLIGLMVTGCKSPFERTKNDSSGGALGTFNSNGRLTVFASELQTGGGAFLYPSGENQVLSFNDTSNAVSARSIRYTWNGQSVDGQIVFAGFTLMHTPTQSTYSTTIGRDLRAAGYTRVTFYARGTLAANNLVKIEVADDGATTTAAPCVSLSESGTMDASPACGTMGTLSPTWQPVTMTVANSNLANVKDFFKATIIDISGSTIPGGGGTVFFDQIEYAP